MCDDLVKYKAGKKMFGRTHINDDCELDFMKNGSNLVNSIVIIGIISTWIYENCSPDNTLQQNTNIMHRCKITFH